MKKQIVVVGVCIVALILVVGYAAHGIAQSRNCQKPNGNEKACYAPASNTPCFMKMSATSCSGTEYIVANFPDGVEMSASGRTKEISAFCYQSIPCEWNAKREVCAGATDITKWSVPEFKLKTVAKSDEELSDDDPCGD
jgi:hypothetical protein